MQVMSYLDSDEADQPLSSEALYLVWAGSNDYLDTYAFSDSLPPAASELVEAVISHITTAISILADRGANRQVCVGCWFDSPDADVELFLTGDRASHWACSLQCSPAAVPSACVMVSCSSPTAHA